MRVAPVALGVVAGVLGALLPPPARAAQQQSAIIRGLVTGADGRAVAGATVTLLDHLGSRVGATATEPDGRFRFEDVPPGTYTVFAEARPHGADARIVMVQAALPIEIELTLAARIAETVIVRGGDDAPPVTTRVTIAGEALRQLPARLPSRGLQHVLATLPGWAAEDNGLLHVRGVDDGFLYVEDGVPVYDRMDALFGIAPDPATVGSVNVLTGYIPPEYGLKSGAVIEVQSSTVRPAAWAGSVEGSIAGDALRSARALGGGPVGHRASVGVSVAAERSDRFLDPVHPDNLHNEGGVVSGEAHVNFLVSERDLLKIKATGGRSRYQVPHGERQEEAGQDQRQRVRQTAQAGSWQRFWSDALASHLAVYRRHVDADLHASPADMPLTAASDRGHARLGLLAGVTSERGRHTMKAGLEVAHLALREDFSFAVTDAEAAEDAEISDRAAAFTPASPFRFRGRANRSQWSAYVQESLRAGGRFTLDFGVRLDRTRLLVPATGWSPRLGAAYHWPASATTLRGSVNRFFQPPQPEHLLLASSPEARALSPFADREGRGAGDEGGADLEPERQTAWEVGVEQWLAGAARLDAAYWSRRVRNYADPNVFFGTTIVFPNSVARGTARGLDLRFELPRYRGWSAYASYTLSTVEQVGPINGGLFLEETSLAIGPGTRFTPDHDQRHTGAAGLAYRDPGGGLSVSAALRYGSGTPLEVGEDDLDELMERPGAGLVDVRRGRVRPWTVLDLTVAQALRRGRRTETSVRASVLNVTNSAYALNFGNPFSGTHFGAPRTIRVDVRLGLR